MEGLPGEILREILLLVDRPSLYSVFRVSVLWSRLALEQTIVIESEDEFDLVVEQGDILSLVISPIRSTWINKGLSEACSFRYLDLVRFFICRGARKCSYCSRSRFLHYNHLESPNILYWHWDRHQSKHLMNKELGAACREGKTALFKELTVKNKVSRCSYCQRLSKDHLPKEALAKQYLDSVSAASDEWTTFDEYFRMKYEQEWPRCTSMGTRRA